MITKSDWQNAYREILEEGRERIGPPPTPEKIEELLAGSLPEEEAERVREALAYYPELLRVMTEPVPADPSTVVTDEEVAGGLARLRQRIKHESGPSRIRRPRPFRRILMPAAAVVILLAGGILTYRRTHRFEGTPVLLSADGELAGPSAGGQTPHQLSTETDYLLEPAFLPDRKFADYKLELLDLSGDTPRVVESWTDVRQERDGSFPIQLSTKGFIEGRYQLVLYGVDDKPVRLATYTIRLSRR
jgi:hypothetical protein